MCDEKGIDNCGDGSDLEENLTTGCKGQSDNLIIQACHKYTVSVVILWYCRTSDIGDFSLLFSLLSVYSVCHPHVLCYLSVDTHRTLLAGQLLPPEPPPDIPTPPTAFATPPTVAVPSQMNCSISGSAPSPVSITGECFLWFHLSVEQWSNRLHRLNVMSHSCHSSEDSGEWSYCLSNLSLCWRFEKGWGRSGGSS